MLYSLCSLATITEIARRANLPTEAVLRVVNGEPTSEDVASRVAAAIEAVGPPDYPRRTRETLPAEAAARGQLLEPFQRTAEELRPAIPEGVGSAVVEAVRVEVLPVRDEVGELRSLYDNVISRLTRERNERIDDLELVCQLITESWKNADRRLGRIERMLERLELAQADEAPSRLGETAPSPLPPPAQASAVPPEAKTKPYTTPSPVATEPPTQRWAAPGSPARQTQPSPRATIASQAAPPRATQPSAIPAQAVETCEIIWWRGLVTCQFYAARNGEGGLSDAIELSPHFHWRGEGPPEETEEALAAHRTLVEILRADGWEEQPVEPDASWFAVRLRREAR